MKILIVEDQPEKRDQIKDFIKDYISFETIIKDKESLRGALKEIITNSDYELILLDMSMPNFDPSVDDPTDCSPESFAGKELLEQLELRKIQIPVIVITQYSSFEGGTITLDDLSNDLKNKYGNHFLGAVYFNSSSDSWKEELQILLIDYHE